MITGELLTLLHDGKHRTEDYSKLLDILDHFHFNPAPSCRIDGNLVSYVQENLARLRNINISDPGEATVLEALVGISARYVDQKLSIDDIDVQNTRIAEIFWAMLSSLKLLEYSDDNLEIDGDNTKDVNRIVNRMLNRQYEEDGYFSPFYLGIPKENMPYNYLRNPLWVQMDWWYEFNFK